MIRRINRYAEMEPEEKNMVSHRSLALAKVKTWFQEKKPEMGGSAETAVTGA